MFGENMNELKKIIDKSAEQIYGKLNGAIPSVQKEINKTMPGVKWRVKYFFITEQTSSDEYAEFMTTLIQNQNKYSILREKENWTQSGELIKIIEYLEKD